MDDQSTTTSPASSKKLVSVIIVVVLLLLLGSGFYLYNKSHKTTQPVTIQHMDMTPKPSPTLTQEQKTQTATGTATTTTEKTFTITGQNFSFTPNAITVNKGDKVTIVFKNAGGFHDFVLDAFNVKTPLIQTGSSTTVSFVADKVGTFQYYCNVANHRQMGMFGTITVK